MIIGIISGLYSAVQEFSKEVDNHDRTQKKTKGTDNKNNYTSNN